ncbi:MAG: DUF6455 family protein [Nevskiales bacterium]|nr:DUF6455 family protein [Nevskiales bacterium]
MDAMLMLILLLAITAIVAILLLIPALGGGGNAYERSIRRAAKFEKLSRLPLASMLRHRRVDPLQYLQGTPEREIDRALKRCERCSATTTCNMVTADPQPAGSYRFCNNTESIEKVMHPATRKGADAARRPLTVRSAR